MKEHKPKLIKVGKTRAEVDTLIAPLIKAMWESFIETEESCQEHTPGKVFISFPSMQDFTKFMNICIARLDATPRDCQFHTFIFCPPIKTDDCWDYYPFVEDHTGLSDDGYRAEPNVQVKMAVTFPQAHIPMIMEQFAKHHQTRNNPKCWDKSR